MRDARKEFRFAGIFGCVISSAVYNPLKGLDGIEVIINVSISIQEAIYGMGSMYNMGNTYNAITNV